jgi:hypothetical protein
MNPQQTIIHAQNLIHKDQLRQAKNELSPYSDLSGAGIRSSVSPERGERRRLRFEDGRAVVEGEEAIGLNVRERKARLLLTPSKKRRNKEDDQAEGSETETSDIEAEEAFSMDPRLANQGPAGSSSSTTNDDFPPVFQSPGITQPELFSRPAMGQMPRQARKSGREVRGMPGRGSRVLGKTVSAPVGSLWSGAGMDVDTEEGDGFDVSEWAVSEDF